MRNPKGIVIGIVLLTIMGCHAFIFWGFPKTFGMPYNNAENEGCSPFTSLLLDFSSIPDLYVTYDIEKLLSGTVVKVKITNPIKGYNKDSLIEHATLYYLSLGSPSWQTEDFHRDGDHWVSVIPPQSAGARITFFVSAWNGFGVLTTELPEIDNEEVPPVEISVNDPDDAVCNVPAELDILQASIGYDGENIWLRVKCKGDIAPGNPMLSKYNLYGAILKNPDFVPEEKHAYLLNLFGTHVVVYSPLNAMFSAPSTALYEIQTYKAGPLKDVRVDRDVNGNTLLIKFPYEALGENSSRKIGVMVVTAISKSKFSNIAEMIHNIQFQDAAPYMKVHFVSRVIEIE